MMDNEWSLKSNMEITSSWQSSQKETIISYSGSESSITCPSMFKSSIFDDGQSPETPTSSQFVPVFKSSRDNPFQPKENLESAFSAPDHHISISQETENYYSSCPIFSSSDSTSSDISVTMLQSCYIDKSTPDIATVTGQSNEYSAASHEFPNSQPVNVLSGKSLNVLTGQDTSSYEWAQSSYCGRNERKENREFKLMRKIETELNKIDRKIKHGVSQIMLPHYKLMLQQILTAMKKVDDIQDLEIPKTVVEAKKLNKRKKRLSNLFKLHEKLHCLLIEYSISLESEVAMFPSPISDLLPSSNGTHASKPIRKRKRGGKLKPALNYVPEIQLSQSQGIEIVPGENEVVSNSHSNVLKSTTNSMLLDFSKLKVRLIEEGELLPLELGDSWSYWKNNGHDDQETIGLMDADCWW